jgi:undecaprenyl-diphosphatase
LDNPISSFVHVVDGYRGGRYGFPSAHATNSFGLAFYIIYSFRRSLLSITMFLWAVLMCYTRVYLGVHYLGDVVAGMMLGLVNATIIYYLFKRFMPDTVESFKPKDDTSSGLRIPVYVCGASVATMLLLAIFINPS